MKVINDADIASGIEGGRIKDFSLIVRKYETPLLRLVTRYVRDLELARDIVQETFLKVHQNIGRFEGRCSFKNWVYKIALNTARNKLRSLRESEDLEAVVIVDPCLIESNLMQQELLGQLHEFIQSLPEKQRRTIELRVINDLSFKDVASIMSCPYDTAKANYRHGMLKLKEMLLKTERRSA